MGERRSERRARSAAPKLADTSGKRSPLSQRSGDAEFDGDTAVARVLEAALRNRERVERATHGFHTWPAGLHPDAARDLLSLGTGPVLDPFCGGGTILIEAMLAGRDALGCDINPVANMVARARVAITDDAGRTALRGLCRRAADAGRLAGLQAAGRWEASGGGDVFLPSDLPPYLFEWYEPHVIAELHALRTAIGRDPLALAVYSSILVKVSRRESDTANRVVEGKRPIGTTSILFHKRAREYARQLEALEGLVPAGARARVHREDAREIRESGFGMVVTSPPYPGVYDYVPLQQLRLLWLGIDASAAVRAEIGSRRTFRTDRKDAIAEWREDTRRWVRACAKALVPGGRLVVIQGDGNVGGKRIDSLGPLDEAASAAGMGRVARVTVERWDEGLENVRAEHCVAFERRDAPVSS